MNKNIIILLLEKIVKKILSPITKHFQTIQQIETIKTEEYARGCLDTALQLSEEIKKQNLFIEKLIRDHSENLSSLEKKYLEHEQNLRDEYLTNLSNLEKKHSEICESCKKVTEEERKRIANLQMTLNQQLDEAKFIYRKLYDYAVKISEEHSSIMSSAARALALKNELSQVEMELKQLQKKTEPYLITSPLKSFTPF